MTYLMEVNTLEGYPGNRSLECLQANSSRLQSPEKRVSSSLPTFVCISTAIVWQPASQPMTAGVGYSTSVTPKLHKEKKMDGWIALCSTKLVTVTHVCMFIYIQLELFWTGQMMRSLFNNFPALYFINWLAAYTEETLLSSSAATCAADSAGSVVNNRI